MRTAAIWLLISMYGYVFCPGSSCAQGAYHPPLVLLVPLVVIAVTAMLQVPRCNMGICTAYSCCAAGRAEPPLRYISTRIVQGADACVELPFPTLKFKKPSNMVRHRRLPVATPASLPHLWPVCVHMVCRAISSDITAGTGK